MDLYSKLFIYIHTLPICSYVVLHPETHLFQVNWRQSLLQQISHFDIGLSKLIFGRIRSTAMWYIWFVTKAVRQHVQGKPTHTLVTGRWTVLEVCSVQGAALTTPAHNCAKNSSVPTGKTSRSQYKLLHLTFLGVVRLQKRCKKGNL